MILVVVIQVPVSMCEKKMALCKMWVAEVEREPTILSAAIRSSLQVFCYPYPILFTSHQIDQTYATLL